MHFQGCRHVMDEGLCRIFLPFKFKICHLLLSLVFSKTMDASLVNLAFRVQGNNWAINIDLEMLTHVLGSSPAIENAKYNLWGPAKQKGEKVHTNSLFG